MAENGWIDRLQCQQTLYGPLVWHHMLPLYIYRIVNLAHDVDLSQDSFLRKCAHLFKTSGHVSPIISL